MMKIRFKTSLLLMALVVIMLVLSPSTSKAKDLPFHGFVEQSLGGRYDTPNDIKDDLILSETRVQLEYWNALGPAAEFQVKTDIVNDDITDEADIKLREAYIWAYPSPNFEIKAGRQVLTWGTGDLIFINDLFPKDYKSFFLGRDTEYLKAPSDSIKFSFFPKGSIVDVVWTPTFEPDRYLDGERLAYFNTQAGRTIIKDFSSQVGTPEKDWGNGELALRVKKNYKGHELAFYGYRGFYKQPNSKLEFSRLNTYGGSWRSNIFGGIGNFELGYHDSVDNEDGSNPNIPNSYIKGLIGYKRDLGNDLTIGFQYNLEHMQDYDEYKATYPFSNKEYMADENREVTTLRLTKLLNRQTVRLDLFTYYSPTDDDGYLRPKVSYDWTDNLNVAMGGNVFFGDKEHTFFGQLEDNSNLYFRMRYSY